MKPIRLFILISFLSASFVSFGQYKYFYNDTSFKYKDYTIELKNTYCRKGFFLRTTLIVTNPTDKYFIFNGKDVFSTSKKGDKPSHYDKKFVVPPHYSKRMTLKFPDPESGVETIDFNFSEISVTDSVQETHEPFQLKCVEGKKIESKFLTVSIVSKDKTDTDLYVRLKIYYFGKNFVTLNLKNVGITIDNSPACYSHYTKIDKTYFNHNYTDFDYKLLFASDCLPKSGKTKTLLFANVFTEYSLRKMPGFKVKLRLTGQGHSKEDAKEEIDEVD